MYRTELEEGLVGARDKLRRFERMASQRGGMNVFYEALDALVAFTKDSRYMRHRDLIQEHRRAFARALLLNITSIPQEDSYMAGMCMVLLKKEIGEIVSQEPPMSERFEEFRETVRHDSRTHLLLQLLHDHSDGAPITIASLNQRAS